MKLNELLDYVNSGNNLPKAKPLSEILLEAHKKWKGIPDNFAVLAIAKEALLPPMLDLLIIFLGLHKASKEFKI